MKPEVMFHHLLARFPSARVLEVGTKRSDPERSTRAQLPIEVRAVGMDVAVGEDVDVGGDAHRLPFAAESFEGYLAMSVFEHLQQPWVAAAEIDRVVRPGGSVLIGTHQSFPLHAYGRDYFRFSIEGLQALFPAGWLLMSAMYEFPTRLVSDRDPQTATFPAFLGVVVALYKQ